LIPKCAYLRIRHSVAKTSPRRVKPPQAATNETRLVPPRVSGVTGSRVAADYLRRLPCSASRHFRARPLEPIAAAARNAPKPVCGLTGSNCGRAPSAIPTKGRPMAMRAPVEDRSYHQRVEPSDPGKFRSEKQRGCRGFWGGKKRSKGLVVVDVLALRQTPPAPSHQRGEPADHHPQPLEVITWAPARSTPVLTRWGVSPQHSQQDPAIGEATRSESGLPAVFVQTGTGILSAIIFDAAGTTEIQGAKCRVPAGPEHHGAVAVAAEPRAAAAAQIPRRRTNRFSGPWRIEPMLSIALPH